MSLITDLHSGTKPDDIKGVKNIVPPGLKNTVASSRKKRNSQKRFFIILIVLSLFVGLGIFAMRLIPNTNKPFPDLTGEIKNLASLKQNKPAQTELTRPAVPDNQTAGMIVSKPENLKNMTLSNKGINIKPTKKQVGGKKDTSHVGAERNMVLRKKEAESKKAVSAIQTSQNQKTGIAAVLPAKTEYRSTDMSIEKTVLVHHQNIKEQDIFSGNIESSERTVPLHLEDKRSKLLKASYYEETKDYREAITVYEKILASEPDNYKLMNKVAYLLMQLDLPNGAMEYLNRALETNPEYVSAMLNAGIIHGRAKRYSDAEEILLKALRIEPNNRKALFNTALLYEIEGKFDKSRKFYLKLQAYGDRKGVLGIKRVEQMIK